MKRENEGMLQMNQRDTDDHRNSDSQDQSPNNDSGTQDSNTANPSKRQRRNDDEEIRLLIPSKVSGCLIKFFMAC